MTSSRAHALPRTSRRIALAGSWALSLSLGAAGLSSTACIGQLDPPTLVKTPRILAILVDHPESRPGTDLGLGVIAHVPDDPAGLTTRYRWRLCASLPRVLEAAQIPAELPIPDTCETLESTGPTALVPGDRTATLARLLTSLPAGGAFDASFLTRILESAGVPFQVEVDVLDASGAVLVTGLKTLAITTRDTPLPPPTTNPPAVPFTIGDGDGPLEDLSIAMPADLFDLACMATAGPATLPTARELTITPQPSTDWTEEYPIFDYSGSIRIGRENEYYSFYATAGSITDETTRPPDRATTWTSPEAAGTTRLWIIVRDGHLGTRGCWVDLTITAP